MPKLPAYTVALATTLAITSTGCAFRLGDFQLISSKNVAINPEPIKRSVAGEDCKYALLGLIPLNGFVPNMEEAMDRALEKVPDGNVLTDVALYSEATTFILVSRNCLIAKGDVGVLR